MAAKISQAAKVGLFVLLSGGATFVVWKTVSKEVGVGSGYTVHGHIHDATGLALHSRVTIAGIAVGSIEKIALENGEARIDVKMNKDVPLYQNATLGKKSASLLGESNIVLTAGTEDQPKLKDGDQINAIVESASMEQITQSVADIASKVQLVAEQMAKSIGSDKGGQNMTAILQNLADATDAMNRTIRDNQGLIHDSLLHIDEITQQGQPELATILENVRVITENVKGLTASNGQGTDVQSTVASINRASHSLEDALKHVDSVATRIDEGKGTVGRLTKDETLINEVQGVVEGVNDYVGGVTRLQTVVGLRSDYNFLANTIKTYVELRLQPKEDKYYVIQLINDPRGRTGFTQTDVDTTNPTQPAHYRTITTTTTDSFRFTLQFAKRLGPFTGRFGLMESTGGLGLDLHLLNNRFELQNDLFGFGEEIQPRYRVTVAYEFIHRLWLLGGIDHVFTSGERDYFLGLQLRFTDDDLKTILPFAGGAASGH